MLERYCDWAFEVTDGGTVGFHLLVGGPVVVFLGVVLWAIDGNPLYALLGYAIGVTFRSIFR